MVTSINVMQLSLYSSFLDPRSYTMFAASDVIKEKGHEEEYHFVVKKATDNHEAQENEHHVQISPKEQNMQESEVTEPAKTELREEKKEGPPLDDGILTTSKPEGDQDQSSATFLSEREKEAGDTQHHSLKVTAVQSSVHSDEVTNEEPFKDISNGQVEVIVNEDGSNSELVDSVDSIEGPVAGFQRDGSEEISCSATGEAKDISSTPLSQETIEQHEGIKFNNDNHGSKASILICTVESQSPSNLDQRDQKELTSESQEGDKTETGQEDVGSENVILMQSILNNDDHELCQDLQLISQQKTEVENSDNQIVGENYVNV